MGTGVRTASPRGAAQARRGHTAAEGAVHGRSYGFREFYLNLSNFLRKPELDPFKINPFSTTLSSQFFLFRPLIPRDNVFPTRGGCLRPLFIYIFVMLTRSSAVIGREDGVTYFA